MSVRDTCDVAYVAIIETMTAEEREQFDSDLNTPPGEQRRRRSSGAEGIMAAMTMRTA